MKLIKLFFYLIFNIHKADVVITWFADYHAAVMVLVAKIFNKKCIIFLGGHDTICYPELGKGVYNKKIRSICVKYAIRNASLLIPNHKSLIYHENNYYTPESPHIDGVAHYVKNFKTPYEVIYNGIDSTKFHRNNAIIKENDLVLTVGTMNRTSDFYNKGFDLFIEVARRNPDLKFVIISLKAEYNDWVEQNYRVSEISNLTIVPSFCPDELLFEYYNKAKVFVQASITEGMPNTLSEAMLCECIPVGSNINGIPDAIGDTGIIIYKRDAIELEQAIKIARTLNTGLQAKELVLNNFSMALKEDKIRNVITKITDIKV